MRWRWTDDAKVCVRPLSTYRELATREVSLREALAGPLQLSFAVACFVSWTTAGRLLIDHLIFGQLSWAFLPVIQIVALSLVALMWRLDKPWPQLVSMYFRGHMPWLIVIGLMSLLCLIPAGTWPAYRFLLTTDLLPLIFGITIAWCVALSVAFFRAGVGLSWVRSLAVALCFYALQIGFGVAYYAALNQVQPLIGVIP